MVNYLSKFMPRLSSIIFPLANLLKKEVDFTWTDGQEKAFTRVKELLCQAPILAFYDANKKLTVENDACEYGLSTDAAWLPTHICQ